MELPCLQMAFWRRSKDLKKHIFCFNCVLWFKCSASFLSPWSEEKRWQWGALRDRITLENVSGVMLSEKQVRGTTCCHELLRTVGAGDHGKGWIDIRGVTEVQSHRRHFLHGVMTCLHDCCVLRFGDCKRNRVLPLGFTVLRANIRAWVEGHQHMSKKRLFLLGNVCLRQWGAAEGITCVFWLKILLLGFYKAGQALEGRRENTPSKQPDVDALRDPFIFTFLISVLQLRC